MLDVETDSTIMIDEKNEKEAVAEFLGMLGPVLQQLSQLIAADPSTADFCGEILKFAVKPFRAGRSLDGAIDELTEMKKSQADGPRPDDPTTATNKTALQIEQLKQQTEVQKNKDMNQLKAAELQMKDRHEQMKIASAEKMKLADIMAKQQDDQAKAAAQNQKAMHDREKHQMDILGKQHDMQFDAQKMAMAAQAAQARAGRPAGTRPGASGAATIQAAASCAETGISAMSDRDCYTRR